jgi:hypothetical protein
MLGAVAQMCLSLWQSVRFEIWVHESLVG